MYTSSENEVGFCHTVVIRKYLQGICLELFSLLTAAENDHLAEMPQPLIFLVSVSVCNLDGTLPPNFSVSTKLYHPWAGRGSIVSFLLRGFYGKDMPWSYAKAGLLV